MLAMSYGSVMYGLGADGGPPAVVPRVSDDDGSSSMPVDRLILPMMRAGERGLVVITAPPGGGKTTALRYLQAVLPDYGGITFFDQQPAEARAAARSSLAILADVPAGAAGDALASFSLVPWSLDDCIEYLAARHRDQLTRVLKLLSKDDWVPTFAGSPQLLATIMDAMATDETLRNAQEAMRSHIEALHVPGVVLDALLTQCCVSLGLAVLPLSAEQTFSPYWHFLRHSAARRIWVGHAIAMQLSLEKIPICMTGTNLLAAGVLGEIAAAVGARPLAVKALEKLIADNPEAPAVPLAASILLRNQSDWRPEDGKRLNFRGADLRSAKWAGVDLRKADCRGANLSHADLEGACIRLASGIDFTGANLKKSDLLGAFLREAKLIGADLTEAEARKCDLSLADCSSAIFASTDLGEAKLLKTNLNGATLSLALLDSARLVRTNVEGARFEHVEFRRADLRSVQLNKASWTSPSFRRATLRRCNLEGLELPGADFTKADCTGSLFTSSRIPRGIFVGANLQKTGLAEIEWDHADLRDADFTNASFHLGSSRSGLVGSTIPSEGSRTGFYTDDFTEQDFKSPEEIRKACLCGADLSGAEVEKTDFYLVDLRGAKYSQIQTRHFRSCGAILVNKTG
jgi:uncharacterized protein YjbI with pentapeptide repeats/energy-coupling factor transporter ATP-binding protein EcfA2